MGGGQINVRINVFVLFLSLSLSDEKRKELKKTVANYKSVVGS